MEAEAEVVAEAEVEVEEVAVVAAAVRTLLDDHLPVFGLMNVG